jgi:DNA-binding SARP family transcriptional activator
VLLTRAGGSVLSVAPAGLDTWRFERDVEEGRRALHAGGPERAARRLRDGLALWRGPPLADFRYDAFAQAEIARLEELRLGALEERIEADLARGRHATLVGELETLVAEQPLRERLRGQLMLALYRCGCPGALRSVRRPAAGARRGARRWPVGWDRPARSSLQVRSSRLTVCVCLRCPPACQVSAPRSARLAARPRRSP